MVIDFGDLKEIIMNVIDRELDHGIMMHMFDPYKKDFERYREEDGQKTTHWKPITITTTSLAT